MVRLILCASLSILAACNRMMIAEEENLISADIETAFESEIIEAAALWGQSEKIISENGNDEIYLINCLPLCKNNPMPGITIIKPGSDLKIKKSIIIIAIDLCNEYGMDIVTVLAHEFGHGFGMKHTGDKTDIMFEQYGYSESPNDRERSAVEMMLNGDSRWPSTGRFSYWRESLPQYKIRADI